MAEKKVKLGFTFLIYEDDTYDFPKVAGIEDGFGLVALTRIAEHNALSMAIKAIQGEPPVSSPPDPEK